MSKFDDLKDNFQFKVLTEENAELKRRIQDLEKTLRIYGIEKKDEEKVTDAEALCINEIARLREASEFGPLSHDDAKVFDLMHKNLLLAVQKEGKKIPKGKKTSVGELISIAKGDANG